MLSYTNLVFCLASEKMICLQPVGIFTWYNLKNGPNFLTNRYGPSIPSRPARSAYSRTARSIFVAQIGCDAPPTRATETPRAAAATCSTEIDEIDGAAPVTSWSKAAISSSHQSGQYLIPFRYPRMVLKILRLEFTVHAK
jgi:hypothetical protein